MKKTVILGLVALSLCGMGCTASRTGIQQIQEPRAVTVADYTPSIVEVRKAIFSGVHAAKWRAQDRAPGLIFATNRWRGSLVTIAVDYTATTYTVLYKDSTDDDYSAESGNIPKDFPRWASFIAKNIDEKIALLGQEAQTQIRAFPRIAPVLPGEPVTLEGKEDVDSFKLENKHDGRVNTLFGTQDKATVFVEDSQKQVKKAPLSNSTPAQSPMIEERDLDEPVVSDQENTSSVLPAPVLSAPGPMEKKVESVTPSMDATEEVTSKKMTTSTTPLSSLTPLPTASSKVVDRAPEPERVPSAPQKPDPRDEQGLEQSPPVIKAIPVNLLIPENSAPEAEHPASDEEKEVKEEATPPVQEDISPVSSSVNPSEKEPLKESSLELAPVLISVPAATSGPEFGPAPVVKPQQQASKAENIPNVIRAIPVQLLVPQSQGNEGQNMQDEVVQDETVPLSSQ